MWAGGPVRSRAGYADPTSRRTAAAMTVTIRLLPKPHRVGAFSARIIRWRERVRAALGPPSDLRILLAAVPVLAVLPLTLFAAGLLSMLADLHGTEVRRELQVTGNALAIGVDRELGGSIRRLHTLADLAAGQQDTDDATFVRVAQRELRRNDDWLNLVLITSDGRIAFSARPLPDASGATVTPQSHWQEVLRTGHPTVSDVFEGPLFGVPAVTVSVPVERAGQPRAVLAAQLSPQVLAERLADTVVREGAVGELLDRQGRIVARSIDHAAGFGQAAAPAALALARSRPSGTAEPFPTGTGDAALGAWARLPVGWTLMLSVPAPQASLARPVVLLALLGGGLLVITVVLSTVIARRITGIVARAGHAAREVAQARRPDLAEPAIRQFSVLFEAMNEAGERVVDALERERCARTAAEQADRGKDRFLVMLGHELRNPLNAVANAGHLLRRRDLSPGERDGVVEMLQRQSRLLRRLVDDLLELGRVLTGRFGLRREPVAVEVLLRQSIAALAASGQLSGHQIRVDLEPLTAEVDPARFEQIFVNLLTNALKYTPTGGTVTIRLGRECDALRLSVHDTGIGIAPDQLRRIFDLFVQGPQVEGRAAGGLGVGLSMARLLAELHGGTIEAYSSGPGLGAEFVARIPLEGRQTPE